MTTILLGTAFAVAGLVLMVLSSTRAVSHLGSLAASSSIPPFFIGITLVAVGTDLPEIANSLVSCYLGHGDLNAGDSVGSVLTQSTLVLGLLPLLAGPFEIRRIRVLALAVVTMLALQTGVFVMRDSFLSRMDGLVLLLVWVVGSFVVIRQLTPAAEPLEVPEEPRRFYHAASALVYLGLVAGGATLLVRALVMLSGELGVGQYVLAFIVGALGTSLPELVVDITAIRSGLKDLAIGDVLGSSFVDASLSIGIGPLFFPAVVTAGDSSRGSALVVAAIAMGALILSTSKRHNRIKGVLLIAVYVATYVVLFSGVGPLAD